MNWYHEPAVFGDIRILQGLDLSFLKKGNSLNGKIIDLNEIVLGVAVAMLIVHFAIDIDARGFEGAYCVLVEDHFNQQNLSFHFQERYLFLGKLWASQ